MSNTGSVIEVKKRVLPNYYFLFFPILMTVLGLLVMLSLGFNDGMLTVKKQGIFLLLATIIMFAVIFIDHKILLVFSKFFMVVALILLILIGFTPLGITVGGATRWLNLLGFTIQGSEIAKFAIIMYLSALSSIAFRQWKPYQILETTLFILAIIFLVYKEPDLGTTIIIASIVFGWLLVMGVKLIYFIPIAGIVSAGVLVLAFTTGYQKNRLLTFIDPYKDETGMGYQIIQGWTSIGSGGIFGSGFAGNKNSIYYLPANHTDFIFSSFAETFGLLGCILLLLFIILFVYFGFTLANSLKSIYNQSLAFLITMLIGFQFILNICVNLGLVPTTGIPLPFLSNGGTALIVFFALCGLLAKLSMIAKTEEGDSEK